MTITAPPTVDALPEPPNPGDRLTFNSKAYPWSLALGDMTAEMNSVASWTYSTATQVQSAAEAVQNTSGTYLTFVGTLTVATGTLSITIDTGKFYATGQFVIIANMATPSTYMSGQITSYNSGTGALVVNITAVSGSGSVSGTWALSLTANPDAAFIKNTPAGGIAATNVQAAINELDNEKVSKSGDTMTGNLIVEKETGSEVDVAVRGYSVGPVMHGYFSNGTKATPTAVTAGQLLFGIGARPYDGSAYSAHSTAAIHMNATENHSATNQGTSFNILVTPAGTTEANRKYAITYESPSLSGPIYAKALLSGAIGSRYYFQTSEANAGSSFGVVPNGTGTNSAFNALTSSDLTNYSLGQFRAGIDTGDIRITSSSAGTGALLPIRSYLNSTKNTEQPATGGFLVTGGALGYGVGAGGTVTQATSKSTTVTLNKPCGQITMNGAALAAGATVAFTFSNTFFTATDLMVVATASPFGNYSVRASYSAPGTTVIYVTNTSGGSLSEAVVLNFAVIKGAIS